LAIDDLARTECPAITARRARRSEQGGVAQDPIVWAEARGANVCDVDGNVYVDLTSAFAVAGIGHAHPEVVEAVREQAGRLVHAMGDVFPAGVKIDLATRLAAIAPGDLEVSIFGMAGSEAVEAALKTAAVATEKSDIVAFEGSYHGLGYGSLSVTGYNDAFKKPFLGQLGGFGTHVPYADCYRCPLGRTYPDCEVACLDLVRDVLEQPEFEPAALIVEPILGRGGIVVPPDEWLVGLVELCRSKGVLVIFDEIYTGFGRTGRWFACEHMGLVPDLMCIGKALGGGFPISAVIGSRAVMDRWGLSGGEAIHTSTFLGNPLGCAMALAVIEVIERENLIGTAAALGERLEARLLELAERHSVIGDVRGRGAMWGVELVTDRKTREPAGDLAMGLTRGLLESGYIVLPAGVHGNVIGLTPPFAVTDEQLDGFFAAFDCELACRA
jgi:4-aminobutyrate aminotransferase